MKNNFLFTSANLAKTLLTGLIIAAFTSCQTEDDTVTTSSLNEDDTVTTSSLNLETNTKQNSGSTNLSVMSYNIFQLPSTGLIFYENHINELRQLEFNQILRPENQADVLVIQEGFNKYADAAFDNVRLNRVYPYKTRLLGLNCDSMVAGDCGNGILYTNGGLIIFSKYPIVNPTDRPTEYVFKSKEFGVQEGYANKGAIYAAIEKNGRRFHVFGTHTNSEQPGYPAKEIRQAQLKEIRDFKNSLDIPSYEPVIYAGDMNIEHDNTEEINGMKNSLRANMNYNFDGRGSYSYLNTAVQNTYLTHSGADLKYNKTLDYVLYSTEHLEPIGNPETVRFTIKYNITAQTANSNSPVNLRDLSDHDPVRVNYTFPPAIAIPDSN